MRTTILVVFLFIFSLTGLAEAPLTPVHLGVASWYGQQFEGHKMANGAKFHKDLVTAAHKTIPLGTIIHITNTRNGKSADVVITDRGPWIKGRDLDLSEGAAKKLGCIQTGICHVEFFKK
jgi:rare lipoprotein A